MKRGLAELFFDREIEVVGVVVFGWNNGEMWKQLPPPSLEHKRRRAARLALKRQLRAHDKQCTCKHRPQNTIWRKCGNLAAERDSRQRANQ